MTTRISFASMNSNTFFRAAAPGLAWLSAATLFLAILCAAILAAPPVRAQDAPVHTISEDITSFSLGPGGRIAFAVRHTYKSKHYIMERDDIWTEDPGGKRHRLLNSEKFILGEGAFSYSVNSYRWSPDGRHLLAELFTSRALDGDNGPHDQILLLMLDSDGKELKVPIPESQVADATSGGWMDGGQTVLYLSEVIKPRLLFSILSAHPGAGPDAPAKARHAALFNGRTFVDAAFDPVRNLVFAIERDRNLSGPPRLQRFDLNQETDTELVTLGNFAEGFSLSPSGALAAYYIDREVLEIRDLAAPRRAARVRIGLGKYQWAPGEKRILLRRSTEKQSAQLVWIDLPPLLLVPPRKSGEDEEVDAIPATEVEFHPVLHGLLFRDFQISPDGKFLAVVPPGKRHLEIYPLPSR